MGWYGNLRVRTKLLVSFSIVIVFVLILAATSIFTINRLDVSYTYLLNFPQARLENLMQVDKYCTDMRRTTTAISLNLSNVDTVETYWKQFEQVYGDAIQLSNQYVENSRLDTERDPAILHTNTEIMLKLIKQLASYKEHAAEAVAFARTGDFEATNTAFLAGAPLISEAVDHIAGLITSASTYTDDVSDANTREKNAAVITLFIIPAVIVLLCIAIALYISHLISKPIVTLTAFMKKAGMEGDFTLAEEDVKNIRSLAMVKDEIGQCIGATARFVEHLTQISGQLDKVAGGDLTTEVLLLSPKDVMGVSLGKMLLNLNKMFLDIRTASDQVSTGAEQVSQGAQELASGSGRQAASIEELSATLSEMRDKTNRNADDTANAQQANNKAGEKLWECMDSMERMLESMREIDESSSRITKVIKVIDDIAFQTNILALNAAVEAARAGQHGKGFAVVADEVRNLAAKSAEAAKETSVLIEGSTERVREGNAIVAQTSANLEAVAENAKVSLQLLDQVAAASIEQTTAIVEINQGMEQIAAVVQATSATAEQSAAASEEMSAQAVVMNEIVSKFKLRPSEHPSIGLLGQGGVRTPGRSGGFAITTSVF